MTWDAILIGFGISLLASIIGVGLVLWIDRQRRPRLRMTVGIPGTIDKFDPLHRPVTTFLHVRIDNERTKFPVSLFYDADARNVSMSFGHRFGEFSVYGLGT